MGKVACRMGATSAWKYSFKLKTKINKSMMCGIKRAIFSAKVMYLTTKKVR